MRLSRNTAMKLPNLYEEAKDELDGDIWDARNLPGVRFIASSSQRRLHFTNVCPAFRPLAKQYLRMRVVTVSFLECRGTLRYLNIFFDFYVALEPEAVGFQAVSRDVIEAYIHHLVGQTGRDGKSAAPRHRWQALVYLYHFFEYLQRISHPAAPSVLVSKLIWPEDRGTWKQQKGQGFDKHVPQFVLDQLDRHIHKLDAEYIPVLIILMASGFRISDVLNLRYDTCLERTPNGWALCGDIHKTQVKRHKIPITDDVARVIAAQRDLVRTTVLDVVNPMRYLFPSNRPSRRGLPLTQDGLRMSLKKWAIESKIVDVDGNVYNFRPHAFRHTKAMELLNNGMSLELVQKWLAHASPEMTLHYAKLTEDTLRRKWEDAMALGAVRIDEHGDAQTVAELDLENDEMLDIEYLRHNLDAVRVEMGYCFKPKKVACPTQAIPCHTCHQFCTTREFLPAFEKQRQDTLKMIELCDASSRTQAALRNRQNLVPVERIIKALNEKGIHHEAGKAVREYTSKEREKGGSDEKSA